MLFWRQKMKISLQPNNTARCWKTDMAASAHLRPVFTFEEKTTIVRSIFFPTLFDFAECGQLTSEVVQEAIEGTKSVKHETYLNLLRVH